MVHIPYNAFHYVCTLYNGMPVKKGVRLYCHHLRKTSPPVLSLSYLSNKITCYGMRKFNVRLFCYKKKMQYNVVVF